MDEISPTLTVIAPSLDDKRIYPIRELQPGGVHRTRTVFRHASGKGANAARAAAALGGMVLLCAPAGPRIRALLEEQFAFSGVTLDLAETELETRSCVTVLEEDGRATEFVQEALPMEAHEREVFTRLMIRSCAREGVVLLAGSLPAGLPEDLYMVAANQAYGHGARVIIDAHRAPLRAALAARPDIVKINREELRMTAGEGETTDLAASLIADGARAVVVTNGADPVLLLVKDAPPEWIAVPSVPPVNAVGSGDAFSGALALALLRGLPLRDAVRYGIAAGSANAMTPLPGDLDPAAVDRFFNEIP